MRLGDWKGLGWGSVNRAVSHLFTFLLDHRYTPLLRVRFSQARSGRVWGHAPCPLCHPSLAPGAEMVSVQLSWPETRQLLLALRLGPLGRAPDSGV